MKKIALMFALVALVACAQVPRQASYPLSYQKTMQSSSHWKDLASEIAESVQPAVINGSVFVSEVDNSQFGNAMRSFLKTELEQRGIRVADKQMSVYELTWEVQKVTFKAKRSNPAWFGVPVAIADFFQAMFVGGVDVDPVKPHSELIVSFDLFKKDNDKLVSVMPNKDSHVFYINDMDRENYKDVAQRNVSEKDVLSVVDYRVTNN